MVIYFILMCFWGFIYLITKDLSRRYPGNDWAKVNTLFMGGSLFLVMGLRHYSVGADTIQYLYRYNYVVAPLNKDLFSIPEWGFQGFAAILKNIGISDQGYIIIVSLIISITFSYLFYKHSKNIFLSFYLHLTIGLFTMSMSGIRQTLAVCIIIIAFNFVLKKKLIPFLITVFIAFTFHNTAICFLPVYFFKNIKLNKKRGILLLIITYSTLVFRGQIAYLMQFILPTKYSDYQLISNEYPINPIVVLVALAIPTACISLWNYSIENVNDRLLNIYSILFLLTCFYAFANILSLNSNLLGRLSFYFVPFSMILIPNVIEDIKDKGIKYIAYTFCIMLPFIQFIMATPGGRLIIDHYKFFWQGNNYFGG